MQRFKEHLAMQLRFIDRSCRVYDEGDQGEAHRIAVALRVICHQPNKGKSTSLLTHLGATEISLLSTSVPVGARTILAPNNLASLVIRVSDQGATFRSVPPLGDAPAKRFVAFSDWWDGEVVCLTGEGKPGHAGLFFGPEWCGLRSKSRFLRGRSTNCS